MPKRGSDLAEFLYEALYSNKYNNLFWVNQDAQLFCLKCIHGGNKEWNKRDSQVFEDWRIKKKRRQTEKNVYSESRQRFLAAMNKCKLLKKCKTMCTVSEKFYQFLSSDDSETDNLSGETSGGDHSPEHVMDDDINNTYEEAFTILTNLNPEFTDENILYAGGDFLNSDLFDFSQPVIDPNVIRKNEAVDEQVSDVPVCFSDISEENGATFNLMCDDGAVMTGEQNFELSQMVDIENAVATVAGDETLTPDSILKLSPDPQNLGAIFPAVKVFKCGDYIIGLTKVPKL